MRPLIQHIATSFSCGALGALLACLLLWALGLYGINAALGVALAPGLTRYWLYPYVVWGGLWALLFLLPWRNAWFARGLLLCVPPLLVQLFVLFPGAGAGAAGLGLGVLTPVYALPQLRGMALIGANAAHAKCFPLRRLPATSGIISREQREPNPVPSPGLACHILRSTPHVQSQ